MSWRPGTVAQMRNRFFQKHRPEHLLLSVILVVAAVARLYGIAKESIWLDESTSLMLARMDIPTLIEWTALDIHPPLYYILLRYWIVLGQSELVIRGLSTLAGVLNVLVLYALGRALFDRQTGLLAALLLALAPLHVWYSQEARMYAWITLLVTSSLLLAVLLLWTGRSGNDVGPRQKRRWTIWVGYVIVTTAALYTHYYAVFGILLENLLFLYLLLRRRIDRGLLWHWLISQVVVFLLFLPWFPTFLLPITVGGGGWVALGLGKPGFVAFVHTAVAYMVGTGRSLYPVLVRRAAYVLFVGLFGLGLWPKRSREQGSAVERTELNTREAIGFCLAYLALPPGIAWLSSQVFKPMYSTRYLLPFLIPFLLLVARGLRNVSRAGVRAGLVLALVALMGVGLYAQVEMMEKPDWRGVSEEMVERWQKGDLVLLVPGWHGRPLDYYAQGALELYGDVPVPVELYGDKPLKAVEGAIAGHPRIWFVWETDHYTDREGVVYNYLRAHCREIDEMPMPLVGRVILFENLGAAGGS